jgi:hypothetical protein
MCVSRGVHQQVNVACRSGRCFFDTSDQDIKNQNSYGILIGTGKVKLLKKFDSHE